MLHQVDNKGDFFKRTISFNSSIVGLTKDNINNHNDIKHNNDINLYSPQERNIYRLNTAHNDE